MGSKYYLKKGIDGFFVDNCDVYYIYKKEGIYKGLNDILKSSKSLNKKAIINAGNTFIKEYYKRNHNTKSILDGVNQECIFTTINFNKGTFGKSSIQNRNYYFSYFKILAKDKRKIFLLEYTKNSFFAKQIINYCNKKGWAYYISKSIELN